MTRVTLHPERAKQKGERTRRAILEVAVDLASVEGLEGLTIGRLASELDMSKSGLFAHFGSKEDLQVATVQAARDIFLEEVIKPSLRAPRGIARLEALADSWISYGERKVFRGGCFFDAAATEFDGRPGAVRDLVAQNWNDWLAMLETSVRKAQQAGEIDPADDPRQIAYEMNALTTAANRSAQLLGDPKGWKHARRAIHRLLASIRTDRPAESSE